MHTCDEAESEDFFWKIWAVYAVSVYTWIYNGLTPENLKGTVFEVKLVHMSS